MSAVLETKAAANESLTVTLKMDDSLRGQLRQAEGIVAVAEAYQIEDGATAQLANDELRNVIARKKKVDEWRTGFVRPAREIIENARALFNPALEALEKAEGILKQGLLGWNQREEKRIADERRAQEDAARKARQEAEARAAQERARSEEIQRKAREDARLAEERRQKAEAEAKAAREAGDRRAAAEAERRAQTEAAERARREEEERKAIEEGERKAQEAQLAAAAQTPAAPVAAAATPKGFGMKKNWIAELEPGKTEDDAKVAIAKAIAEGRRDLLPMLALDMKAAGKLAKALEANFSVPCLKARNAPVATSRAA